MRTLEDLAFELNKYISAEGTGFEALVHDNAVMEVVCSNNDEFPINVALTETQILSVTPLFNKDAIKGDKLIELNEMFLQLSPAIPLSSMAKQGDNYILFGAMAVNTTFENFAHELEVQAGNTIEVLDAVAVNEFFDIEEA
jgi:uncharacterized protein YjfI (DUF2170 family)